jgi:hypothetical protein
MGSSSRHRAGNQTDPTDRVGQGRVDASGGTAGIQEDAAVWPMSRGRAVAPEEAGDGHGGGTTPWECWA